MRTRIYSSSAATGARAMVTERARQTLLDSETGASITRLSDHPLGKP